jgi:micrococcal nuclease
LKKIVLIIALLSAPAFAHQVIGVADGDTLTVLQDRKPVRIRLADIDAPEKHQPFGERAKQALSDLCFGKDAILDVRTTDRYGRVVARVTCAGVDANRALVEHGMAWHYLRYSTDIGLASVQEQAKASKRGLWADPDPVPPWDYRRK